MKFYGGMGPNPRVVSLFFLEKGLEVPLVEVDLMKGENREPAHLARNPAGQLPTLELDDGQFLSEITAICEYIDELHPEPSLMGATAEERALTRMWVRRIDLNICEPIVGAFRYGEGLSMFKDRIRTIPEAASGLKVLAQEQLAWLDGVCAGRSFVAGDRFTLADILLYGFLEFGANVGQPFSEDLQWVSSWYARISERASVKAG
ncbi:MAG: glutathione S-transferase [Deltaproteobacteria bacterium]|nr:glutathione S-transferase [Deltaproteobacteria bacterium]